MATDDAEEPRGLGWGYIVYQQIAGVAGAFALIAFLGHFVQIDWRGALADLVSVWDSSVRPAMNLILEVLVAWPLEWLFNWHLNIPLSVRDYSAVGVVLFFSNFRMALWVQRKHDLPLSMRLYDYWRGIPSWLMLFLACLAIWPFVISASLEMASTKSSRRGVPRPPLFRRAAALSLSPLFYLVLLLVANFVMLQPV